MRDASSLSGSRDSPATTPTPLQRLLMREYPASRPVMRQRWSQLLFLHWPVDPEWIRSRLPAGLHVDLFDNRGWMGVVPFAMERVHPVGLPPLPWISWFLELNVRTYVHDDAGRPGVCFFPWIATNRWLSRWHADFSTFPTITRESMRRVRMVKLSTPVSAGDQRTHRAFATAVQSALNPRQSIRSSGFWLSDTCFSPPIAGVKSGLGECTTPLTGSRLQIVRSGRQSRSSRMGLAASKGRPPRCLWLNPWMCGFSPSCRR
jgi:hypothetical protein